MATFEQTLEGIRPAGRPSSQRASTRPRSASLIKIGYRLPDFSPVSLAIPYPCCHSRGSAHSAASTDNVWAENSARRAMTTNPT